MSWGYKIAILFFGFVIFMSSLVYMAVREDFYLVTEDYYTEGIAYDDTQAKIEKVKSLKEKISYQQTTDKITIMMPTEIKEGTLKFFRPSNGTLDFSMPITSKEIKIEKDGIKKGKWIIKFSWSDGQEEYYFEESINIL